MPDCFKKFGDAMCEPGAESVSDIDEEIAYWNMFYTFLHIVTSYPTGGTLELLLTDEELAELDSVVT